MLRSGDLRHRVRFESQTSGQDAAGQPLNTWTEVVTCWAKVESVIGREMFNAAAERSEQLVKIQIRGEVATQYSLTEQMRLVHLGRTYIIESLLHPNNVHEDCIVMARWGMKNG